MLPASLLSVIAFGQVQTDTVLVKPTIVIDTVVVPNRGNVEQKEVISIKENVDTVVVKVGKRGLYVHENNSGDVSVWTTTYGKKKKNFYPHLDGFGLGINVYLNKDGKMTLPAGYEGMDLNVSKSVNVALNLFSVSTPLISNKFGVVAGLGTEWHNYRFDDNVTLQRDQVNHKVVVVPLDPKADVLKTKLTDWWLNVPVAFELNNGKKKSFYVSVGAIGSILLNSHTKVVTQNNGKNKEKVWNQFYLNPFRASLLAKAGYGDWGVYATYSLTQLFQDGKGPELYPFAAGVTLNF